MKEYRVSRAGRTRAIILMITTGAIALYAAQKAWGLWRAPVHDYDPTFFGFDLDKFVPAGLLTLVALAAVPVIWYLGVELLTIVQLDQGGMLVKAPGFRLFYRWDEIQALDVITGPVEDAATCLQVETQPAENAENLALNAVSEESKPADPIESYLSEADLREDKQARKRAGEARKAQLKSIRQRARRPDGTELKGWVRLLYPQARRPDQLFLYPSLENRTALLAEIEDFLSRA